MGVASRGLNARVRPNPTSSATPQWGSRTCCRRLPPLGGSGLLFNVKNGCKCLILRSRSRINSWNSHPLAQNVGLKHSLFAQNVSRTKVILVGPRDYVCGPLQVLVRRSKNTQPFRWVFSNACMALRSRSRASPVLVIRRRETVHAPLVPRADPAPGSSDTWYQAAHDRGSP